MTRSNIAGTTTTYTYTYDKRGNRVEETGKKESRRYFYDETNRMVEGTGWKGDKSAYPYNGLGLSVGNTQTTHAGKVYTRDYVTDYISFENDQAGPACGERDRTGAVLAAERFLPKVMVSGRRNF